MSLAKRVVTRPVTWLIVFALIVGLGMYLAGLLPVDQFPEVEMPILMVNTGYGEVAPEEVEQNLTRLLEGALANVSNIEKITSTSSKGSSRITLEFTYGTDLAEAADDVRDRLEQVKDYLPAEADSPSIMKFDPSMLPILRLAVRGERTPDELYAIAEDSIQAKLERIEGVASTSISGGREQIVRVEIPRDRLQAYGLTLTEVAAALRTQNMEGSGGEVTEGSRSYVVTTRGRFAGLEEMGMTVVGSRGGQAIRLRDLTEVSMGYEDTESMVYVNGEPGVYLQIQKQSGTNSIEVADAVLARLEEIGNQLPAGTELEVIMDTTTTVRNSVGQVTSSAIYGVAFAVLVLLLFLRRLKSTLIVAVAIPVAILVTIIGMYFMNISFNMISLTGLVLALGMVVDGSIVILENIYRYREKGSKLDTAAVLGTQEMTRAITASTLTTVSVFLPLILFQDRLGMTGQLIRDLSFTVVVALLASLFVAVMLVPVLASHTLPVYTTRQRPIRSRFLQRLDRLLERALAGLQGAYRRGLAFVLRYRLATLGVVLALVVWAFTLVPRVGFQFMPAQSDDTIQVDVELPAGTTLEKMEEVLARFEEIAREEIRGIQNLVTTAGSRGWFGGSTSNVGDLQITLSGEGDNYWAAQRKLRRHFGDFPGATMSFGSFHRLQSGSDVDVAVKSDDLERALKAARRIESLIEENLPQVKEPELDVDDGLPQIEVVVDREKAFDLGLSMGTISSEIEAAMAGRTATVYRSGGDEYNVLVILDQADRSEIPDLERIFVAGSRGQRLPVASFAHLEKGTGAVDIKRENQGRVVHVTGNLLPGVKADLVEARLHELIDNNIVQDDDLTIEYAGSMSDLNETGGELAIIAIMALLLVFGVMAALFESFKDPFIIFFTIPLLFVGVILMYLLTGEPFSIITGIGVVVLLGIVVNNGIVLVDYTNLLRSRGREVREACIEAGGNRLRPILMTSLTTILAMTPMAFFPGEGAEIVRPIGQTVIGGLSISTLVTLFLVPAIYSLFNEKRRRRKERSQKPQLVEERTAPAAILAGAPAGRRRAR